MGPMGGDEDLLIRRALDLEPPRREADGARLKFNPLANVTLAELKKFYTAMNLPPHPLVASGFTSIGCMPCTTRTKPGEDPRAGRWRDRNKIECGIHVTTDVAKSS